MNFKWFLFNFNGRIPRSKWWLGFLVLMVTSAIPIALLNLAGDDWVFVVDSEHKLNYIVILIFLIFLALQVWIGLAIGMKRFHDRGKSGWWLLINFAPLIGPIWILVECGMLRGTQGENAYGKDPI